MTPEEIEKALKYINNMTHYELARLWRFGSSDHLYLKTPELFEVVKNRLFNEYGGMTPTISKLVGWDE